MFKDERLDVMYAYSVLINEELFVFKDGTVRAFKYSKFTDKEMFAKTTLGILPHRDALYNFSVCKLASNEKIVLTGGFTNRKPSGKVFALETQTGKWQTQPLPDLNVARAGHASLSIEHHVYVACGMGDGDKLLRTIEVLSLVGDGAGPLSWDLIDLTELTPRMYPVFSQVAHN